MDFKNYKMKKTILFLFTIFSFFLVSAQGNLQFNQVLTFTGNTTETNIYTVPVGKVAKITKAIDYTASSSQWNVQLKLNGAKPPQGKDLTGVWLKENDIVGSLQGSSGNENYIISIIEYNIIP